MPGDTNPNTTVLNIRMNDPAGSTTFTDSSPSQRIITTSGSVKTVKSFGRPGKTSAYFNGAGYLSTPTDSGMQIGTNDFTISFYMAVLSKSRYQFILGPSEVGYLQFALSTAGAQQLALGKHQAGWFASFNGFNPPEGELFNLEVTRQSGINRCFIDGGQIGGDVSDNTDWQFAPTLYIGKHAVNGYELQGFISEMRIKVGEAVHTSNYTPSPLPYPISGNTYTLTGVAKFTDGAVATMAKVWDREAGIEIATITPNPATGEFSVETDAGEFDIGIYKEGYRPLFHGPVTPETT